MRGQRAAAKAAGQTTFISSKPCKYGHHSPRHVADGACLACRKEWNTENRAYYAGWARQNVPRKGRAAPLLTEEQKKANRKKCNDAQKARDPEGFRTRHLEASVRWRSRNPGKVLHYTRMREEAIKERTPPWADLEAIKAIYENCPNGYEVDHIFPLRGKFASGLHIASNLQYLLVVDNRRKGNRMPEL